MAGSVLRTVAIGIAAIFVGTTASVAADKDAMPYFDWAGWYAGGYAGAIVNDQFDGGNIGGTGASLTGAVGGVHVYYNKRIHGKWIVSPFAAANLFSPDTVAPFVTTVDPQFGVYGGARLGYDLGKALPYVFLGGALVGIDTSDFGSNTHTGHILGAGIDFAVKDRLVIGTRFTHYGLNQQDYDGEVTGWSGSSLVGTMSVKLHE